jgi:hypothetical protein
MLRPSRRSRELKFERASPDECSSRGAIELDVPLQKFALTPNGRSTLAEAARSAGITLGLAQFHIKAFRNVGLMTSGKRS